MRAETPSRDAQGQRRRHLRGYLLGQLLVHRVDIGMDEADGDRLDPLKVRHVSVLRALNFKLIEVIHRAGQ